MTKPVFDDEFKQGVVDYANQHPEESKVSIAKSFGIADSRRAPTRPPAAAAAPWPAGVYPGWGFSQCAARPPHPR